MAEILRTWLCQNCENQFDAWEANPGCPECGCVRVSWVPGGGHVRGIATGADAEFRQLADNFGLSDLRSAVRGERAKPTIAQPIVDQRAAPAVQFAPGFAAVPHPERAVCVPSTQHVDFKARADIGRALPRSRSVPGMQSHTAIEATYRPPK